MLLCRGLSETSALFYFVGGMLYGESENNNCGFSVDLNIGTAFLCSVVAIMYLMLRKFQKVVVIY
jgi:hypothetical protein